MVTSTAGTRPLGARRSSSARTMFEEALASAGIRIDGADPWDLHVLDDRLYDRVDVERLGVAPLLGVVPREGGGRRG